MEKIKIKAKKRLWTRKINNLSYTLWHVLSNENIEYEMLETFEGLKKKVTFTKKPFTGDQRPRKKIN